MLSRRRFSGALLGALAVVAVGLGPACGGDSAGTAGTRDDPFPYKDPKAHCGAHRCFAPFRRIAGHYCPLALLAFRKLQPLPARSGQTHERPGR